MPIHVQVTRASARVTFDRQDRRNALNAEALEDLDAAMSHALTSGARTLTLTGAGGHFCAGADLAELEDIGFTDRLAQVLTRLCEAPIVTLAVIEGACMGLGMQLALACDIRIVADSAQFALPVARLGLMVDQWTLRRACALIGEGATRHLVLAGAVLSADDAWRLGFAQERGGIEIAEAIATRCGALAPLSQSGSKLGFGGESWLPQHQEVYRSAFERAWASEDLLEGRSAFAERRPPTFRGR